MWTGADAAPSLSSSTVFGFDVTNGGTIKPEGKPPEKVSSEVWTSVPGCLASGPRQATH